VTVDRRGFTSHVGRQYCVCVDKKKNTRTLSLQCSVDLGRLWTVVFT